MNCLINDTFVPAKAFRLMINRYDSLGVSASKDEIHDAIKELDKGLFPNAFCKILPDLVAKDSLYCNIIHADTAGSKTSLAYLYWKETGDLSVWKNIAQDALVMNIDDMACVGAYTDIVISSTIGRNKHLIPKEIIKTLIASSNEILQQLSSHGISIISGGGETADVGDIVRTIDVGITAFSRMPQEKVIPINIKPGSVIVGFASFGQTTYENKYNSGIGSNGLTAARHDVLNKFYLEHYPESCSPETLDEYKYTGRHRLTDQYKQKDKNYTVGELLLSPTRTYLPVLKEIIDQHRSQIQGIIHCTGGAQTKVKKFINKVKIIKNNLFELPPVFELIRECTLCSDHEMYQVYNMGHRLEIYTDEITANQMIEIAAKFNLEAKIIGHVESSDSEEIVIDSFMGTFNY